MSLAFIRKATAAGLMLATLSAVAQVPPPKPAAPAAPTAPAPATPSQDKDGRIRVQVSAIQQTTLSAELNAKISSLPLKEGDAFRAGQTLASFDCSLFQAQAHKADASAEAARQTLKVNRRLAELGSISNLEVDQSSAKSKETEAEAAAMRVTVSKCAITAPFAGRVAKLYVEPYQYVQQGKPLLDIVDSNKLEVKLIVPSKWLAWLTKGTKFNLHVDDLNKDIPAKVTRIGARIDPVNQSVLVAGEVDGQQTGLLSGMGGWATFNLPK